MALRDVRDPGVSLSCCSREAEKCNFYPGQPCAPIKVRGSIIKEGENKYMGNSIVPTVVVKKRRN